MNAAIKWMMNKAVTEISNGYECGKFSGKLNYRMVQSIEGYLKTVNADHKSWDKFTAYYFFDDTDTNTYTIKFYKNGIVELTYEIAQ